MWLTLSSTALFGPAAVIPLAGRGRRVRHTFPSLLRRGRISIPSHAEAPYPFILVAIVMALHVNTDSTDIKWCTQHIYAMMIAHAYINTQQGVKLDFTVVLL